MKTDTQNAPVGHTPLPWHCHDTEREVICAASGRAIASVGGRSTSPETDAENRLLIIESVNSRPALLARVARLEAALEKAAVDIQSAADSLRDEYPGTAIAYHHFAEQARAALADKA